MSNTKKPLKAREAAYLALLSSLKGECFIIEFLNRWQKHDSPSLQDFHLAQEISCGSMRMSLALDHLAAQLADKKKLSLKLTEKALLRTAIYQYYYMDRIPLYAIADESVAMAHKYCHRTFAYFLNAILRKIETVDFSIPQGNNSLDLSIRYSYPQFFVEQLLNSYGVDTTLQILELGNRPSPTMFRLRPSAYDQLNSLSGVSWVCKEPFPMAAIENSAQLPSFANSSDYYIQNATPATLIGKLCQGLSKSPERVLDVCAAPGGKSIAVHDFFPKTSLYANDISETKIGLLTHNFAKYGIHASVSCLDGQHLNYSEPFSVIILDVPCSNSGVLYKRAEARWRLTPQALEDIEQTQLQLIKKSTQLLHKNGEIWYLTCSILPQENESLIQKACQLFSLKTPTSSLTILPNKEGWDGGFSAILTI